VDQNVIESLDIPAASSVEAIEHLSVADSVSEFDLMAAVSFFLINILALRH
jgi:hypothetical protein